MQQILAPLSKALVISASSAFKVPLYCTVDIFISTARFLLVFSKTSIIGLTSAPLACNTVQGMSCFPEKIGLLKRLKKASLPRSTLCLFPNYNKGAGISLASIFSGRLLNLRPISYKALISLAFFNCSTRYSISPNFSEGSLIVFSETFFLLISSKLSGIPVISSSSGMR